MDYQRIAVSLIGNATKDGAVKAARESGHVYGDFTLAVRDKQQETHFFPVRCFSKLAEGVTNIRKGAKVFVDGELELGVFDGEDGKKQMTFRVLANAYRLLNTGRPPAAEAAQAERP